MQWLKTFDDWRRTPKAMATLGPTSINRFSIGNIVLLMAQDPDVTRAATFNAWQKRERTVKKGARALTILRPRFTRATKKADDDDDRSVCGFSYITVFGLAQTEGPSLKVVKPVDVATPDGFDRTLVCKLPTVSSEHHASLPSPGHPARAYGWF